MKCWGVSSAGKRKFAGVVAVWDGRSVFFAFFFQKLAIKVVISFFQVPFMDTRGNNMREKLISYNHEPKLIWVPKDGITEMKGIVTMKWLNR